MKIKIEIETLKELLVSFYHSTGVRTMILDDEFNPILAYPTANCQFCSLIMNNPSSKHLCKDDIKTACIESSKSNKFFIYKCHAGLFGIVTSIKSNDILLGYIMLSQVIDKNYDNSHLLCYASEFVDDKTTLINAHKKLTKKTKQEISALARLLEILSYYLETTSIIGIDDENIISNLSNYINENIRNGITIESLINHFKMPRNKLYKIFYKYYGMSISKYIRHKRVLIAAEHLKKADIRICDAAQQAGFTDYNYFSKIFKRELGVTPREYRKRI